MPDLFVFLAGVFFALTAVLLAALARHIHRLGQRLAALERRARPGLSPEQEAENMAQERMRYQGA